MPPGDAKAPIDVCNVAVVNTALPIDGTFLMCRFCHSLTPFRLPLHRWCKCELGVDHAGN